MSLSPAIIDAMVASGCTAEQLAAVVKAALGEQEAKANEKRAKDAERQRRHRRSRNVTVTECDAPPPPAPFPPNPPIPTHPRPYNNTPLPPKGGAEPVLIDEPAKPDPVAELVETWNEIAGIHGLPAVRTLSDTRRRKAAKRIAEHGLDEMRECVGRIACSPFLSGKKTDFRADFDFLVNPSKLTRLQEGFYDERGHDPPAKPILRHHHRNGASGIIGQFTQGLRA